MKFRKTTLIEAVQWQPGATVEGVCEEPCLVAGSYVVRDPHVHTLEGMFAVSPGDWIAGPGARGEFWPIKPDVFAATYAPANSTSPVDAQAEVARLTAEVATEREKRAAVEARLAEAVLRLRRLRGIADDLRDAISRPPLLAPFLGSCVAQMHEETDRGLLAAVSDVVFELRPCGRPLPCPRHGGHPKPPCAACKGYKVVASQTLYGFFNPCKACDGMGVPPGTPTQFCQEMVVA